MPVEGFQDAPRSLALPGAVAARRRMLGEAHIAALTAYVQTLRKTQPNCEFPDFDPLDGGSDADILFLYAKPGPMTSAWGKIVLVGLRAQRATPLITKLGMRVIVSAHPSPLVRASQPKVWAAIPQVWAQAVS